MFQPKARMNLKEDSSSGAIEHFLFRKRALLGKPEVFRQQTKNDDHAADELARAAISTIQTMDFALDYKRAEEIRKVDDAIERWVKGRYGRCVACDEMIEQRRLEALPDTEFCIACKEILERKANEYAH